jgi:hypothetical protein
LLEHFLLHITRELWLQQDAASPHSRSQVTVFLSQHFQNRWSGRQGPVAWPPKSPVLTPFDYYLCGHMKYLVYALKSSIIVEPMNRITDASAHIRNDKTLVLMRVSSISRRTTVCTDK